MSKRNRDRRGDGSRPQERRDAGQQDNDSTEAAERAALRADLESPDDAAGGADRGDDGFAAEPESQRERWLKYGSNVVLVSVVVVVLAVLVTWLAQRPGFHKPIDTTRLKLYSLKPQTLQVLRKVDDTLGKDQRIELVSLYTEKPEEDEDITAGQPKEKFDYAGPVRDLLQEYKRNSGKIDVDVIDPVASPAKVDALIERVTNQYGGEVKRYQDFLNNWPKRFRPVKEAVAREQAEAQRIAPVLESSGGGTVSLAIESVARLSEQLDKLQSQLDRRLKQRPPDYKGATDDIHDLLQDMSSLVGQIATAFEHVPGVVPASQPSTTQPATGPSAGAATQPSESASSSSSSSSSSAADAAESKLPPPLMAYLRESLPRYRDLKRQMDDILKQISGLGELKLDELKQKLRERNGILVLGPTEMRSLSFADVWQINPDVKQMLRAQDASQIKPEFAGEQQITTAIWGVTAEGKKKPKVVFVRAGGQPLASPGSPFQRGGPLAAIAQRLREYNFDVAEKDLSGQWAIQSRQMGAMMPPEPEPSDEEMKGAVWVVLDLQAPTSMGAPPADIGARLAAHLDAGGSAMVLASPRGSDLASALGKWGIQLRTDAITVHEPVKSEVQSGDFIEEAKKLPFIFVLNQYGDHLITRPMRSLDAVMVGNIVIRSNPTQGATVTPLLTTPSDMKTWGETDVEKALGEDRTVTYDPKTDIAEGPMILAAAAERQGSAGRLVVVGGIDWAAGGILRMPDPQLARKGVIAARFPGNAELFTNSIFWLSKMDTMIAISPSAMEVSRIKQIPESALRFWHYGVLIVGLPLAVIAAGTMVYLGRRD